MIDEAAALESVRYLVLKLVNRCLRANPYLERHRDDIEQEAMADALIAIRSWRPGEKSTLSSWVGTAVAFKLKRHWKIYSEQKGVHVPLNRWTYGQLDEHDRRMLRPAAPMEAAEHVPARDERSHDKHEAIESAMAILGVLPLRLWRIVQWRFGLFGEARLSLQEIADKMSLSRERVRQLEKMALERLGAFAEPA